MLIIVKNIIFDFGNVLFEWNQDEIVTNYSNNKEALVENVVWKGIFLI